MKKLFLLAALGFSANSFASSDSYIEFAIQRLEPTEGFQNYQTLEPRIRFSSADVQRIYFFFNRVAFKNGDKLSTDTEIDRDECSLFADSTDPKAEEGFKESVIFNINGTNVKMDSYCSTYSDSGDQFMYFTPKTNKGLNYVVSTFKRSNSVRMKSDVANIDFNLSAIGFTKAWNSYGGDAI